MDRPIATRRFRGRVGVALAALFPMLFQTACAGRARMCVASSECAASSACVAGRCQLQGVNVVPAIASSERLVFRPVDAAHVGPEGTTSWADACRASTFVLGPAGERLLLRFAIALPERARVVEAYLVLHRSSFAEGDPEASTLRVDRIVEPWDGTTTSWAFAPKTQDVRSPLTRVSPGGPSLVRLDVGELVRGWSTHDPRDRGLAVVAAEAGSMGRGTAFAWCADPSTRGMTWEPGAPNAPREAGNGGGEADVSDDVGPYLEVYVRDPDAETSATASKKAPAASKKAPEASKKTPEAAPPVKKMSPRPSDVLPKSP